MDNQILIDLVLDMKKDVSQITQDLGDVKIETIKNTGQLEKHMMRSDMSEARLDVQEEKLEHFITEMAPVKEHVKSVATLTKFMGGAIKILGILASVVGVLLSILKFLR